MERAEKKAAELKVRKWKEIRHLIWHLFISNCLFFGLLWHRSFKAWERVEKSCIILDPMHLLRHSVTQVTFFFFIFLRWLRHSWRLYKLRTNIWRACYRGWSLSHQRYVCFDIVVMESLQFCRPQQTLASVTHLSVLSTPWLTLLCSEGGSITCIPEGELCVISEQPGAGESAAEAGARPTGGLQPDLSGQIWTGSPQPCHDRPTTACTGEVPGLHRHTQYHKRPRNWTDAHLLLRIYQKSQTQGGGADSDSLRRGDPEAFQTAAHPVAFPWRALL